MKRVLVLALWLMALAVGAQNAREVFGTNRIQYKDFKWAYISGENFDIYYYGDRKTLAAETLNFLEGEFDRITDLIGYPPYLKTKVFLYNSVADLKQSNIGLNHNPYIMGGETEFVQPYVEIAHPGTLIEFKDELLLNVTDLMVNEMMFGGSLREMFQQSVLLNLPEWFIEGAAYYVARGWDSEMDDFARQLVRSRKVNRATNLTGREAALAGQSIWNYIVEKYGKSSLSNILNYSRVIRNEQRSVLITLGIPFRQLMSDWKQFYLSAEQKVSSDYIFPADSNYFSPSHRKTAAFTAMKISPNGRYFAYAENDRGKYIVKVKSLANGNETTILNGGLKVLDQRVDYRIPLLSWSDDHTLGVIGEEKGSFTFWLYDLNTRSKLPRELAKFNNVRSFDFSDNGRLLVLSADQDGQNDLFLLSSRRDRVRRLTNDIFDDLDPSFIPNSNSIVFSSNRTTDTVNLKRNGLKDIRTNDYNLFMYDLDSTTNVVNRLTNSVGKDYYPAAADENTIFYLSDQRGITNLFRFDRATKIYTQVTNFASGIKEYDIDFNTNTFAMVAAKRMADEIYVFKDFDRNRQIFTPPTKRQDAFQAKQLIERRKNTSGNKTMSLKDLINQRLKEVNADSAQQDTVQQSKPKPVVKKDSVSRTDDNKTISTDNYSFEDAPPVSQPKVTPEKSTEEKKPINTQDYVFEDEVKTANQPSNSFLSRYLKTNTATRINGPFPYMPKVSWSNLMVNMVVDPIRGWSFRADTQMNDILENFKLTGGIQVAMNDWKSGDVYVDVQYLPKRIDHGIRFDRKLIYWVNPSTGYQEKYSYQKMEYNLSLPLLTRLRATVKPFASFTRFVDRGIESPGSSAGAPKFNKSEQQFYAGAKAELVFDNSVTTGLNIIEGTRGKISFTNYQALGKSSRSFSHVVVDFRHYQKIYKEIVLAVRGFGGTFFGRSPKQYALGGMDNWLGNRTNYDGVGNPLIQEKGYNQNLLFLEFATTMRGFDYATFYGNSALVGNVEMRIPLVRALSSGPIASNFFRNMQFTAFYDVGTSWSGKPNFSGTQSTRSRIVGGGNSPFEIKIDEYLNPWLYSYGFGFRSMIFGYYTKIDFAWPVENYIVNNPRIHLTLGFDF